MALWAIPAGHLRAGRGLARVGGVACQRTSPVRVIRAALKPCITPRLGPDVLLAGKPRFVAKLHRPWPGGVVSPARANSSLVPRGAETTALPPTMPAVTMWTRPSDRAASCGACGQGMDKCCALAHPLSTLAALAPTSSPLLQQRLMGKATAPTGSRIAPSSQAIRLRNKPANSHGGSTRKCEKQQPAQPMGGVGARAPRGEHRGGGVGEQDRAHRVGVAHARTELSRSAGVGGG